MRGPRSNSRAGMPELGFVLGGDSAVSARAGLLPICLTHAPVGAFDGIPIFLRSSAMVGKDAPKGSVSFILYCAEHACFDAEHRQRLIEHGVRFIYIPVSYHERFRRQTESLILQIVHDPKISASVKSEIIYETSIELVNELLSEPSLNQHGERLGIVSKAVTSLVLEDPMAFSHLFAASHHDFYTATHLVNVATWMVSLAYALGERDEEKLATYCRAGILHDIGKVRIPSRILNKKTALTADEWRTVRQHPELGQAYLKDSGITDATMIAVTLGHHERLDGSGYPFGLKGEQIELPARICAVVDSFDALTSLRPFKMRATSVTKAMELIFGDTPAKYDSRVVETWADLVRTVDRGVASLKEIAGDGSNRRRFPRYEFNCPARLTNVPGREMRTIGAVIHNLSRSGFGLLAPIALEPGDEVNLHLRPPRGTHVQQAYQTVVMRCRAAPDGWYEIGVAFGPQ